MHMSLSPFQSHQYFALLTITMTTMMSILTDSLLHSLTTIPYQTPGFGSMCTQDPSRKCRLCM